MAEHTVRQGDSIVSIAYRYGLLWGTIWDHPNNAELCRQQDDKNILYPGDVLFIPDRCEKEENGQTWQRHRFRRRGVPEHIRLRFVEDRPPEHEAGGMPAEDQPEQRTAEGQEAQPTEAQRTEPADGHRTDDEPATQLPAEGDQAEQEGRQDVPRAGVPYLLNVDGELTEGETGDDGAIEFSIPPDGQLARVTLHPTTPQTETYAFRIGHLNPVSGISGVKQRLANLGFDCGEVNEQATPELEDALRQFQRKYDLPVNGEADEQTRARLVEVHES